jgi:DNA uptake protein ComE-like DNA-binding protein
MKLSTAIIVGVAASGLLVLAAPWFRRKQRPSKITTADLGYQERSPEELASANLLDLNTASQDEFLRLGLDGEMCDRIVENRPYRNKLDLLSRMVIPEQAYSVIRDLVGVARATESIKVAG